MHRHSQRGQATVGYALVVGIALIGTVTVVALGATALTDIQDASSAGAAEQAMTQFDSQTAQVALGDSDRQTVSVGQTDGSYQVDPDAGYVEIVHMNFDGNKNGGGDMNDEVIYESKLGTVSYERGDTTIAYQSGGVWKRTSNGGSRMVSPPEFHYRGSTLTFPIVRVNQDSGSVESGGGNIDLQVTSSGDPQQVFPDKNSMYADTDGDGDSDGGAYQNPSEDGTMVVYIESEYYEAWADYFGDRTDGAIQTSDTGGDLITANPDPDGDGDTSQVVAIELVSTGETGPFPMPGEGSSLNVAGVSDHSMSDFEITLIPDKSDSANFNNLQWSMFADDGGKEFEMHVRKDGGGGQCDSQEFAVRIFYSPEGTDNYHGWEETGITGECYDADDDGTADEIKLSISFVDDDPTGDGVSEREDSNENDIKLEYTSLSNNALLHFSSQGRSLISDPTFDQHSGSVSWESITYDGSPNTEFSDGLVNHYFSLLGPGFDVTVDDSKNNGVQESASSGYIQYTGGDQFITYVHLSENDVEVTIG